MIDLKPVFLSTACVLVVGLNGCASEPKFQWVHPMNSPQQFYADSGDCQGQAMQFNPYLAQGNPQAFGAFAGLYAAQAQANAALMNAAAQIQMFDTCMYSRGYAKQPLR